MRNQHAIDARPADLPAGLVHSLLADSELAATAAGERLWRWFTLATPAPRWGPADREAARAVIEAALAAGGELVARERLRAGLLRLTAVCWAERLATELAAADEDVWKLALGERYEPVRRCCAPRTAWRTRTLSDLLRSDRAAVAAISARLGNWMSSGWDLRTLPAELEAALVHGRVPPRLA